MLTSELLSNNLMYFAVEEYLMGRKETLTLKYTRSLTTNKVDYNFVISAVNNQTIVISGLDKDNKLLACKPEQKILVTINGVQFRNFQVQLNAITLYNISLAASSINNVMIEVYNASISDSGFIVMKSLMSIVNRNPSEKFKPTTDEDFDLDKSFLAKNTGAWNDVSNISIKNGAIDTDMRVFVAKFNDPNFGTADIWQNTGQFQIVDISRSKQSSDSIIKKTKGLFLCSKAGKSYQTMKDVDNVGRIYDILSCSISVNTDANKLVLDTPSIKPFTPSIIISRSFK